jgi:hypothetical protein
MENKNQITYFFGAGASYHAIPTIDGLPDRIKNLILFLQDILEKVEAGNIYSETYQKLNSQKETLTTLIIELNWLVDASDPHQTVDTLAKKFYVQRDDISLCRLKRALMIYFFFEQNISFPNYSEKKNEHELLLDKRYDNLIASIAERNETGVNFKDHIKIITWNYDLQIDFAIKNYFPGKFVTLNKVKNDNHIHPNQNSYNKGAEGLLNKFAVIKLNGNAFLDDAFKNNGHDGVTVSDFRFQEKNISEEDILGNFLVDYGKIFPQGVNSNHEVYRYFNFAWEKDDKYPGHQNVISEAIKIINATKVLIIVGYSFPYFNSEIDKQLFANCNPNQIIIQDLFPEQIKERLLQLLPQNNIPFDVSKIKMMSLGKYFPIHPET